MSTECYPVPLVIIDALYPIKEKSGVNKYVDSSLGADESLQEGCQVLVDVGLLILNKE